MWHPFQDCHGQGATAAPQAKLKKMKVKWPLVWKVFSCWLIKSNYLGQKTLWQEVILEKLAKKCVFLAKSLKFHQFSEITFCEVVRALFNHTILFFLVSMKMPFKWGVTLVCFENFQNFRFCLRSSSETLHVAVLKKVP